MSTGEIMSRRPWAVRSLVLATLLSATVLFAPAAGAANFGAASSEDLTSPAEPNQVVAGDFDGDSNQDLAFVNIEDNTVILRRGDGSGGVTSPWAELDVETGGGDGPYALAAGDFNDDGDLDIAVANIYSDNVSVFTGGGDGTFSAATVYDVGVNPTSITAADFDGDAVADLAVTNYGDDNVSILLNDGTGLFAAAVNYTTGAGPWAVRSAVLTASGEQDLIVANFTDDTVSVLTGNGNGTFDAKSDTAVGSGPTSVATGDFDGDSSLDVAVTDFADDTVSVLLGDGLGGLAAAVAYDAGLEPIAVTVGDFNGTVDPDTGAGDGNLDLAVANRGDDNITIMRGDGAGAFTLAGNYDVGVGPSSIIAVDLNGDAIPGLVTANRFDSTGSILLAQDETDAPVGSITIDEGVWIDDVGVNLSLTASEESGGAITMQVCNTSDCSDGGDTDWIAFDDAMTWDLLAGDGLKTVYVWFQDARGNISAPFFATIILDGTAPGKPIVINNNEDYANSATVTLSMGGAGSTQMRVCNSADCTVDNTGWIDYAATKEWTLTAGDGTKTVYAEFRNTRKTSSQFLDSIILDTTAPTGTLVINSDKSTTLDTSATLTIEASEESGGDIEMKVCNTNDCSDPGDDPDFIAFASSRAWTLIAEAGAKTVYVWFRDARGNTSGSTSDSITLTTAQPTGSIVINNGDLSTIEQAATLQLTMSGNTVDMCISNSNASPCTVWIPARTTLDWLLADADDGDKTVYAWFRTEDGIVSEEYSDFITIDKTAPSDGTVIINDGDATTFSTNVTLELFSTDAVTVVSEMCISNTETCTDWIKYATTLAWTLDAIDGVKTVYARFKDAQGNFTVTPATDTIILDASAPTGTVVINDDDASTKLVATTLTLAATDDSEITEMCVSNTAVCANGSGWIPYVTSKSWNLVAGDGTKTVNAWFKDEWGNTTAAGSPNSDTILLDTAAPTGGSISIDAGATATDSTAVELTLAATDATEVAEMCISNTTTCSSWIAFESPADWTLTSGDGVKTVRVWFKDVLGNANVTAVSDTITLDTTAPTGSVVINGAATNTNTTAVTLTLAAAGATHMCISNTNDTVTKDECPGSGWLAFATSKPWTLSGGDGSKTVYVWYKDALTNTNASPYSDSINLDSGAPTGTSISINAGAAYTKLTSVTLTLAATDATQMCISNTATCSGTSWITYATSKTWAVTAGAGLKTVYVKFRDAIGNEAAQINDTITLDATVPTNGTVTAADGVSEIVLTWSGFTDAGSGVASYKVVTSTSAAPTNCSGAAIYEGALLTYTHTGLTNGTTHFYRVCAIDNATNISTGAIDSAKALAEIDPPEGTVSINAAAAATKTTSVTLTLTATDVTGPIQMCVSNTATCSSYTTFATSKSWVLPAGNGDKTVYVWFKDSLGNTSEPVTDTIELDTVAPVNGTLTATGGDTKTDLSWSGFSDAGSGIANYKLVYLTTASPASTCSTGTVIDAAIAADATTYTHDDPPLTNGTTYYYRLCAIDTAGNTSTGAIANAKPKPESDPPTGTVSINADASYTKTSTVTLTMTVADTDNSTPYQMCVTNTDPATQACTAYITYAATKSWTLASGNLLKTVYVLFKDKWGNTSDTYSDDITLDATKPTDGTLVVAPIDSQNDLTWSGFADAGSGIDSYKLVFSTTSTPSSCATGTTIYTGSDTAFSHTGLTNGTTYYYRLCATDTAGNTSVGATASGRSVPETDGPADGTLTINGGSPFTKTLAVTLSLSATDASTISQMCVSNTATSAATCSPWVTYATTKAWALASGTATPKTVNVWFKDEWANTSDLTTGSIGYDTVKPVDGTVTPTAGDTQVVLDWAGFGDALSGVASYKLVFSTTASAPTTCTGTAIYTGPDSVTTFTHIGLTNGTTYRYRLCAYDNAGNLSVGATTSATPAP